MVLKKNDFFILFNLFFLVLMVFSSSLDGFLFFIGQSSLLLFVVSLFFGLIIYQRIIIQIDLVKVLTPLIILFFIYFFSLFWSEYYLLGISQLLQVFFVILTIYIYYNISYVNDEKNFLFIIKTVISVFVLFFSLLTILGFSGVLGFKNENYLGLWLSIHGFVIFGLIKSSLIRNIMMFFVFLAIYITESRTALLGLLIALIIRFFWPVIKNKYVYAVLTFIIFLMPFLIIYIFSKSESLIIFNDIVRDYSGKNLLSGREEIWPIVIQLINENIYLGWGAGYQLKYLSYFDYSVHNLYLQIALQVGLIGLFFLLVGFGTLFFYIWKFKYLEYAKEAYGLVFIIMFSQNFEVTLTQNNISLSWVLWIFVAFFIGSSRRKADIEKRRVE